MLTLAALLCTAIDWDLSTYRNAKREADRLGKPLIVYVGKDNAPPKAVMDKLDAIFCWVERLTGFEEPCVLVLQPKATWAYKLHKPELADLLKALAPAKPEPAGASPAYPRGPARGC